jgi:hypothetical protein
MLRSCPVVPNPSESVNLIIPNPGQAYPSAFAPRATSVPATRSGRCDGETGDAASFGPSRSA